MLRNATWNAGRSFEKEIALVLREGLVGALASDSHSISKAPNGSNALLAISEKRDGNQNRRVGS
jgi:tyrosine-protein phosphatase YwqE